jgi:hypothetical protein
VFFVIAPCYLFQLSAGAFGHLALCGQFLILWAAHLLMQARHCNRTWLLLCAVSIIVHVYLFSMVFVLFAVSVASHSRTKSQASLNLIKQFVLQICLVVAVSMGTFWVVGGFESKGSDGGDAYVGATLTTFMDPKVSVHGYSWSSIVPDISSGGGLVENISFLGLATLLLLPFALAFIIKNFRSLNVHKVGLIIAALVLFAFSLSPNIWVASRKLVSYEPPLILAQILQSFRTVDRYSWVLVYVLMTVSFAAICFFVRKTNLRVALLLVLLGVQFFDMRTAISETRERFTTSSYQSPLISPLWKQLGSEYKRLETVPPLNFDPHWFDFALYADTWGLSTNAAGLARVSSEEFAALVAEQQAQINNFNFRPDTLYVLTNYPPNPMSEEILRKFGTHNFYQPGLRATEIDGFVIIAP